MSGQSDEAKVGQTIMDIPCYHIDSFEEVVEQNDISIVIISLPSSLAAQYTVPIINAGIKGVLNFTSVPMNFPQGIVVENYDIHHPREGCLLREGCRGE